MEEFRKELTELCKKHGLENAAFCANKESRFLGILSITGSEKLSGIFECSMNVGRLWQQTRHSVKSMLDEHEGSWK